MQQDTGSGYRRRAVILAAVATAYLLVMMDYSIINVALQTIQEDFAASNAQLQWIVSSYEILYAALLLPAGFLADRYGRARVLTLGLLVFAVASGLMVLTATPEQIIALRALMGIGGAVVPATTLAIIKDVFPSPHQGAAMGVWSAVGGASVAVGPILGGALVQYFAWWSIFLINVPLAAACVLIVRRIVPESRTPQTVRLDMTGIALAAISVALLTFGLIRGGETGRWDTLDAIGALSVGALVVAVLVLVERRTTAPMLDVALLRSRSFATGTMSVSLAYFALTGGTFLLVFYIQLIRDQTPLELGLSMLPVAIGAVVGSLIAEALVARTGPRFTTSAAMISLMGGFTIFAFAGARTPQMWIEVAFTAAGMGMGLTMGTTTPLTLQDIPASQAGAAAGLTNTIRGVTSILGVALLGAVYSLHYRSDVTPVLSGIDALSEEANQSLSQTLTALHYVPGLDPGTVAAVTRQSEQAFLAAFHSSIWIAVSVLTIGLVLGLFLLPRNAQQQKTGEGK